MKVLVIGGAGYLGSHAIQAMLKKAAFEVVVFDDLSTGFIESIPTGIKLIRGDVCDTDVLQKVLAENGIEAVLHFAAKLIVPESVRDPAPYYRTNVGGVTSLVDACRKTGVKRIVFSSTAAVYGDVRSNLPVEETYPAAPINPYGSSKLMAERILQDAEVAYGIKTVCLRYFNVAGAASDGKNGQRTRHVTHLIQVACQVALGKREKMEIFGSDYPTPDGTGVRDYIHVDDLADLHVMALEYLNNGGSSQILNCGYGVGFSVKQVISAVEKVAGKKISVHQAGRREGDPSSLVANANKIRQLFSWQPRYSNLEEICRSAFRWEEKQS